MDDGASLCPLKAQQRELTLKHEKEKERELSRKFQLQKEQYESTIQRQLTFIDQVGATQQALDLNPLQLVCFGSELSDWVWLRVRAAHQRQEGSERTL